MATVQASTSSDLRAPLASPQRIPLSEPWLAGHEWAYVKECLDSGWISSVGPFVARFEQMFAEYVGADHAVAVVNGTAGLHVALRAAQVKADEEVLVPTLTFIAPVNAIRYCQAHPVFIDADPRTWQMDVGKVERFLATACEVRQTLGEHACWNRQTGRRVRAMLPVHILGLSCAVDQLLALARHYHVVVIEDAAEAIGVRYHNRHVGTWGHLGVFSFNGNKTLTCGGGGMVVAQKPAADYVRYLTTQARDDSREYHHREVGYNYRLTNLHAAIGLAQLEQADRLLARKRAIAAIYQQALRDVEGITLMPTPEHTEPGNWLYTILLREGTTMVQRNAFIESLAAEGLEARPLWQPIHTLPPYQHCDQAGSLEVAPDLYTRAVSLPSSVRMTDDDLQRCVTCVKRLLTTR